MEGDNVFFCEVDKADSKYNALVEVSGVEVFPSLFLSVHGWGVWIETDNPDSLAESFSDWFLKMKEAAAHEESPY